jgi:hypothetical protein
MKATQVVEVKSRPILYSGPMVRAILAGRKHKTRRIAKWGVKCPDGVVGDRLWVRETWAEDTANGQRRFYYGADEDVWEGNWRPSIFMPREACRIELRIESIEV